MKTIIIILIITISALAQQLYEIIPGTEGNEITITVSNISSAVNAEEVRVSLTKDSPYIVFLTNHREINLIPPGGESDINFIFDVKRSAHVNIKDTIEFSITNQSGINTIKQFIFRYTAPNEFQLEQNYPNPFNPVTVIRYQLPYESRVVLKVYNILGSEVSMPVNELQQAGFKEVMFNASGLATGVYIYRLSADNFSSTRKMMVVK